MIDQLLRTANPVRDIDPEMLVADASLLAEIMASPEPRRGFRRIAVGVAVAAAAAVAAVAGPVFLSGRANAPSGYSASAVEAAERNPRLVIDEPGWKIVHVEGFADDVGSIAYMKDGVTAEIDWYPDDDYSGRLADRASDGSLSESQATALGTDVTVFGYGTAEHEVFFPVDGPSYATIRVGGGPGFDRVALDQLLADLRRVSVADWLAALPADIVKPGTANAALDGILSGVPLPPGFDKASIKVAGTNDRYQFGAKALQPVVCAWLEYADGGPTQLDAAARALGGSRNWPILKEMAATGDFPDTIWALGDWLSTKPPVPTRYGAMDYAELCMDGGNGMIIPEPQQP